MKTKDQLQKTVDDLQASLDKAQSELSALAALSEPLEEFEVKCEYLGSFTAYLHSEPHPIGFDMSHRGQQMENCEHFTLNEATEIHRNLGRLIATAKKRTQ